MHACPPFSAAQVRRVGASLEGLPPCVVFCNELLDAQPFNRLVFSGGRWVELGVAADAEGLHEVLLPEPSPEVAARLHEFPSSADEGYRIDLPLGAERILAPFARQPGVQAIVAFDYGLDWEDLCRRRPAATPPAPTAASSLSRRCSRTPGGQDITCQRLLGSPGTRPGAQRASTTSRSNGRRSHIVRHAVPEDRTHRAPGHTARARATHNELLHPARMGSAFQVLSADAAANSRFYTYSAAGGSGGARGYGPSQLPRERCMALPLFRLVVSRGCSKPGTPMSPSSDAAG
jgi:SAM-dependent MidA family methyltransferase